MNERRRKARTRLLIPVALVAVISLYAALRLLADFAAWRAESVLGHVFQADTRVGQRHVDWNLHIELDDVTVAEARDETLTDPEGTMVLHIRRAVISPDILSLFYGSPRARWVRLEGVSLYGFRGADGRFNLSRWRDRIQSCRARETLGAVPDTISFSGATIILEMTQPGQKAPALRIRNASGGFARARGGRMTFNLAGKTLFSEFTAQGSFRPCSPGELNASVASDAFDFDAVAAFLTENLRVNRGLTRDVAFGLGDLTLKATGHLSAPLVESRASLRDFGVSFVYRDGNLEIRNLVAGIGRERVRGNGLLLLSRAGRPFQMTFHLENMDLARLLKKNLPPQYLPELDLNGEIRLHGSLETGDIVWDGGEISAGPGEFRLPPLGATAGTVETTTYKLRRATAKLAVSKNNFLLKEIHVEGDGFSIAGSGQVAGGFDPADGFDADARGHFDLLLATHEGRARFSLDAADGALRGEMK